MINKHPAQHLTGHLVDLERERLNSLINSMADGVIALDEKGKVIVYNGAALNILDLNSTMNNVYLANTLALVDKNSQPVDVADLIKSTTKAMASRDYRIKYKDGSTINLYLSLAPVHLGYGKEGSRGHVLLLRDITNEKALEEERDDFISVISHELRTPIAIAEGSISNARFINERSDDRAKSDEALKRAHQQIVFLSDMVNDLSTLSRAEGNKLKVDVEPINVHDLIDDLIQGYTPMADTKQLKLIGAADPTLELLHSSHLYVREILQNFITNSIKYTESGSVTIGAKPEQRGVMFSVTDTGIGISQADKKKIFDKFFRSNDERAQSSSGKGLGLYIAQRLSKLLNAKLEVESEINKGSTFTIFIPDLGQGLRI